MPAETQFSIEGMADRLAKMEVYQSIQFSIAETLVATSTLREAAPRILRAICTNLGWHLGMLWMVDKADNCLHLHGSWQSPTVDTRTFLEFSRQTRFCIGESLPGRVWASGSPVWFNDFTQQGFVRSNAAVTDHIRATMAFPIFVDLECVGVMEFFSQAEKNADSDLLDVLVNVGYRIGQYFKRRELEREAQEAKMRYRVMIDSAFSAVVVADVDGYITEWNTAAEEMFGWKRSEIVGQDLTKIMPERFRESHLKGMERVRKSDITYGSRVIGAISDLFGLHRNGCEFPIEMSLATWNTSGQRFFSAIIRPRGDEQNCREEIKTEG